MIRGACAAQRELGVDEVQANARRAPPHAVGRGATAPTLRPVGGRRFKQILNSAFESRGTRPERVSHHRVAPDGPRSTFTRLE